jgi:hypothetical protein
MAHKIESKTTCVLGRMNDPPDENN